MALYRMAPLRSALSLVNGVYPPCGIRVLRSHGWARIGSGRLRPGGLEILGQVSLKGENTEREAPGLHIKQRRADATIEESGSGSEKPAISPYR